MLINLIKRSGLNNIDLFVFVFVLFLLNILPNCISTFYSIFKTTTAETLTSLSEVIMSHGPPSFQFPVTVDMQLVLVWPPASGDSILDSKLVSILYLTLDLPRLSVLSFPSKLNK